MKRRMCIAKVFVLVAVLLAACATPTPEVVKEVVTQVVKETVVVEKEVEVEKVVKETVVVEKEVEKEVEVEKVVEIVTTATPEPELEGTLILAFEGNDTQTWENLAMAYQLLHPKVDVRVELKPVAGRREWVRAQTATDNPPLFISQANGLRTLRQAGKFMNYVDYLDQINPYTGEPWIESFEEGSTDGFRERQEPDKMHFISIIKRQTVFFYNKRIFEEVGITDVPSQPTWEQLLEWGQKIKDAGYIPLSLCGTVECFDGSTATFFKVAYDQYMRDWIEYERCQPGDSCFREGIDDVWTYDPTDPYNDDGNKISWNNVRRYKALYEGDVRLDDACAIEMHENLAQVLGPMTPPGWYGISDPLPLFLKQEAAMLPYGTIFFSLLEKQLKAEGMEQFEVGSFNWPTMTGPCTDGANARTIDTNVGYWGIAKKSKQENDLAVDFLMFVTSPQGLTIYSTNKADPNNPNGYVEPLIVKGASLPDKFKDAFGNLAPIGNTQKTTAGQWASHGMANYQPSVRVWYELTTAFLAGEMTADEYSKAYHQAMVDILPELFTEHMRWADWEKALESPEKDPEVVTE